MGSIRTNIAITLGLKVVFSVATVPNITGLWPAILADTDATVPMNAIGTRFLGSKPSATPWTNL